MAKKLPIDLGATRVTSKLTETNKVGSELADWGEEKIVPWLAKTAQSDTAAGKVLRGLSWVGEQHSKIPGYDFIEGRMVSTGGKAAGALGFDPRIGMLIGAIVMPDATDLLPGVGSVLGGAATKGTKKALGALDNFVPINKTLDMVEDGSLKGFRTSRNRMKVMRQEGLTQYIDEYGKLWRVEGNGVFPRGPNKGKPRFTVREVDARNATMRIIDPYTGKRGTRRNSTLRFTNKRQRNFEVNPEDPLAATMTNKIWEDIDNWNLRDNPTGKRIKYDHPQYRRKEHRIKGKHPWWDGPNGKIKGNYQDDPWNITWTNPHEWKLKDYLEQALTRKHFNQGRDYIVDIDPETRQFHIVRSEDFQPGLLPTEQGIPLKVRNKHEIDLFLEKLRKELVVFPEDKIRAQRAKINAIVGVTDE